MFETLSQGFVSLMNRGGYVMWPLLAMSVLGLTLCLERAWFWLRHHGFGRADWLARLQRRLREGDLAGARALAESSGTVYAHVARELIEQRADEATAAAAVESQRHRIERFMPTLSTIITAAPMLGILGTVIGIIASFELLAQDAGVVEPRAVSAGIAQALITTAAGLVVALVILFPYNALRAQVERSLSRLETLTASAVQARSREHESIKPEMHAGTQSTEVSR